MPISTARIGEGGPLRRLEALCHLTRPQAQIPAALLVAWVPVVLLALGSEALHRDVVPLLHDTGVHVRLLVGIPVLLILDNVFPVACSHAIDQLTRFGFIRELDQPRFDRTLRRTMRLGESWVPELILACIAFVIGCATLLGAMPLGGFTLRGGPAAAEWWYALVSLPLFEFLILRSLWRWAIWVRFLVGLSRIPLDLDVTHPDCRGGISFLRKPSHAYCAMLLFVASAVMSAAWAERMQFDTLRSFLPLLLLFAAAATLVAFGPLMLFAPQLLRIRSEGQLAIGGLAARNGRWFRDQLMDSPGGDAITSSHVQSLAAIASTYRDTVQRIRLLPFDKKDLFYVLLATLAPIVPSMLARIPGHEWIAMASFVFAKGGIP